MITKYYQLITKEYQMEKKLELIQLLEEQREGLHLRELSRLLKTGLPNVLRYVRILEKEGVVTKKKEANLVKVKLKNHLLTIVYLKEIHTKKFLSLPQKVQLAVNDLISEMEEKPLIALIFGSYAKNNFSARSDIDLLLIFQKVEHPEVIENLAKRISMRTNTKISPIYLDYLNFKKNFLDKKHSFSNEIRQDVIVLRGLENYYSLLWGFLE